MHDTPSLPPAAPPTPPQATALVDFWRSAGPDKWFAKNDAFDQTFRARFLQDHEAAARGEYDAWTATPEGTLALLVLLDQFPRNSFRGSARAFATDRQALAHAAEAVDRGDDLRIEETLQPFFYMPFMHSEVLADQERCVALCRRIGGRTLHFAELHRDIVARFGRFPHRNAVLGRSTTAEEQAFLDQGGFAG